MTSYLHWYSWFTACLRTILRYFESGDSREFNILITTYEYIIFINIHLVWYYKSYWFTDLLPFYIIILRHIEFWDNRKFTIFMTTKEHLIFTNTFVVTLFFLFLFLFDITTLGDFVFTQDTHYLQVPYIYTDSYFGLGDA